MCAPASRNEPRGSGGPETRCPCQQKRAARLPSAAPGSIKGGGPETRSGTVQSLKCCPCQQKRAARLPSEPPGSQVLARLPSEPQAASRGRARPEPEVLPLPAETSREVSSAAPGSIKEGGGAKPSAAPGSIKGGGGARNALGYRPEPEVLPLPAETSREAPKCCAWQHQELGPKCCA